LTLPVFFPVVTALGFDPVWFGVLIVLVVQVGLISPPVGMNMFVMNALLKGVGMPAIFRGCAVFCVPLVLGLLLVMLFPQLALWLPSLMK
jgi:C4-dicarboxylate transporter, DctM subunit